MHDYHNRIFSGNLIEWIKWKDEQNEDDLVLVDEKFDVHLSDVLEQQNYVVTLKMDLLALTFVERKRIQILFSKKKRGKKEREVRLVTSIFSYVPSYHIFVYRLLLSIVVAHCGTRSNWEPGRTDPSTPLTSAMKCAALPLSCGCTL